MVDPHDRTERFELIAACEQSALVAHADAVVEDATVEVLQAPTPQLVMQRVVEPVNHQPFNLGEVVVTAAEVALDGAQGFAMVPGKAEKPALSGAVVDAAIESGHPRADAMIETLGADATERERARREQWARRKRTAVDFDEMEDHT